MYEYECTMCMCIVYMCVYVHYVHVCVCALCTYVCVCALCTCVCVCVCVCVCLVYMCVCVHSVHICVVSMRVGGCTDEDGDLLGGRAEGVGHVGLGKNDEGPVDRRSQPADVCMVKECATLVDDPELVYIRLPRLDGTLRDVRWSVRPRCQQLPDTVPASHGIPMLTT